MSCLYPRVRYAHVVNSGFGTLSLLERGWVQPYTRALILSVTEVTPRIYRFELTARNELFSIVLSVPKSDQFDILAPRLDVMSILQSEVSDCVPSYFVLIRGLKSPFVRMEYFNHSQAYQGLSERHGYLPRSLTARLLCGED